MTFEDSERSNERQASDKLLQIQRQLTVLVLALVAFIAFWQIGGFFADIIRILGFSVLFSYLFINVVDYLEKIVRNRAAAILIVYAALGVLTIFGITLIIPAIIFQVTQLCDTTFNQFPQWLDFLVKALEPLEARLHAAQIQVRAVDILTTVAGSIPKPDPAQIIGRMTDVAMSTMTWLFYGLSIIVVSFYFLLDGHNIKESVIKLFPKKHYPFLEVLATDMDIGLQAFFRGQIVLGLLFGAFMIFVYMGLGVHYALLLGIFLGVWEIVPVIGPTIGFIPTVFSAAVDGVDNLPFNRLTQVIIVALVFNLVQWLKDNIVAPRYIGNVIGLHPVMIFIAIMIGARFDGMLGIIYSLPVACLVNVFVTHLSARASAVQKLDGIGDSPTIESVTDDKDVNRHALPEVAQDSGAHEIH
ncbi:MAG: AI-2E family transporter [Candidatus Obscuribacterales bacterium]|nr:AI-2E family transporter [Cyanobacteria bacterium SZAS LIN-5]RTL45108.1 MAG: AI-2E family transporter [Candidatus Melainabacteria bacterium]